jgi:serine protease Do
MTPRPLLLLFAVLLLHAALPLRGAVAHDPDTLPGLVAKVLPSVVSISVIKTAGVVKPPDAPDDSPFMDLFKEFSGKDEEQKGKRATRTQCAGSGFVIDPSGIIATANSVIGEDGTQFIVTFADGSKLDAKILGRDQRSGLAALKVEPEAPLAVLEFGDSDVLWPGEPVFTTATPSA